ncbi:hypothetical protein SAMN05216223_13032 [Actinacidiphila yanglinensis]|uniref:Serine/threonine protein kinase n=1 Tax=Actinacidiphila yanglinensis TaxID=310779 RepID=A0A1H6E9P7_9ACTN|nr:hypothetical protein SAMN05216223_13032 [Actinacidiphila yanglinensis]
MPRPQHGTAAVSLVLIASAFAPLTAGCDTSSRHPAPPATTAPRSEAELRQQAEGALTRSSEVRLHWTGPVNGPTVLPRTTVGLPDGTSYVVEAACAGNGSLGLSRVTKIPHSGSPTVSCDGGTLRYAFTGGDLISFSFQTYKPASAVLAWQVISNQG